MNKRYKQKLFIVINCLLMSTVMQSALAATDTTIIGRYLTVADKPKPAQTDLLSQVIQVRFPQNVQTVGDAIHYILRLSGYSLAPNAQLSNAFKNTLTKSLPAVDRDFGPMSLKDGLATLAGPAFYSVQDPLNRVVNFRVKSQYTHFANDSSSD